MIIRAVLAVVLMFVRVASLVVRGHMRARWTEEWTAELTHAAQVWQSRPSGSMRLALMGCGVALDAVLTHRLPRVTTPSGSRRSLLSSLDQDFRYAIRGVVASPAFALGVVISLGLGIAANTAAFSFINAVVFRPFPGVRDQNDLVRLSMQQPCGRMAWCEAPSTYDDYTVMRSGLSGLGGDLAARTAAEVAVMIRREPRSLHGALVSANYFDVLGATPVLGRAFAAEEESLPHAFVAVIAYDVWRREFQGDPSVLGQSIDVPGGSARIIGVAPYQFSGATKGDMFGRDGRGTEIWLPLGLADSVSAALPVTATASARSERYYTFFGRPSDNADATLIRAQADAMAAAIANGRPATQQQVRLDVTGVWLNDPSRMAPALAIFLAVPLVVLAIACINAMNLLLARATERDREISMRLALGATRWRIVRQLLVESGILAFASAALAILVGYYLSQWMFTMLPVPVPVDTRVLAYTVALTVISTVGFGLLPALRATTGRPHRVLGGSPAGAVPRQGRMRRALIVAQIAMSLGLLATGAQFVSSVSLMGGTAGTDPERLLLVSFDLRQLKYSPPATQEFYRQVLDRVAKLPQAEHAGLARYTTLWTWGLSRGGSFLNVWKPGDRPDGALSYLGGYAGGELFGAVGLRLLQGRLFTVEDAAGPPRVAMVNRPFADRVFGGVAIGKSVRVGARGQPFERGTEVHIVGVVEGTSEPSYSALPVPAIYVPSALEPEPALTLYVKSRGPLEVLTPVLREMLRSIDERVPFIEVASLQQLNDRRLQEDRWAANGMILLGALALLLATAGIYGVVSYVVAMRSREIGVRMALGADPRAMLTMVLRQAMWLAVIGAVLGGGAALVFGRMVRAEMHDVRGTDLTAFLISTVILLATMLVASAVPARRAARTDPMIVLRAE